MDKKTFWLIVRYDPSILYYCGYYLHEQPVVSYAFNNALKLHSEEAATELAAKIQDSRFLVEEHAWM